MGSPGSQTTPNLGIFVAAAGIVALNLAIKLPGLAADSLWLDEAITAFYTQQSAGNVLAYASRQQNPPLYFLLLKAWTSVFANSEAGLRSFSVVASSLTAGAIFILAARFLGLFSALVAALLFTLSPLQFHYAQEARSYALISLLCVLSFQSLFHLRERHERRTVLALALLNAALLYTHYASVFVLLAQGIGCTWPQTHAKRIRRDYLTSTLITGALFLPWISRLLPNIQSAGAGWLSNPDLGNLFSITVSLAGGTWLALLSAFVLAAACLAWSGWIRGSRVSNPAVVPFLLLWVFVPLGADFVVSQFVPIFLERYLLYTTVGLALLLGAALTSLPLGSVGRIIALALLIAASLHGFGSGPRRMEPWRQLSASIAAEQDTAPWIVVSPSWLCLPFAYYFAPDAFVDHVRIRDALVRKRVLCADPEFPSKVPPQIKHPRILVILDQSRPTLDAIDFLPGTGHDYRRVDIGQFGVLRVEDFRPITSR